MIMLMICLCQLISDNDSDTDKNNDYNNVVLQIVCHIFNSSSNCSNELIFTGFSFSLVTI